MVVQVAMEAMAKTVAVAVMVAHPQNAQPVLIVLAAMVATQATAAMAVTAALVAILGAAIPFRLSIMAAMF